MIEMIKKRNALLAVKVIENLKARNMTGYFADTAEEAKKIALDLIPKGSSVTMGGCMSAQQIGLVDALKEGEYNFIDRADFPNKREGMLKAYDADFYLSSVNAMTEDGLLINIDGVGNRVSATAYGPKKVLYIVGMQKICKDADSALKRARGFAAPVNAARLNKNTPCTKTGTCMNCKSPDMICSQFLLTRFAVDPDRVSVILVNEDLGF